MAAGREDVREVVPADAVRRVSVQLAALRHGEQMWLGGGLRADARADAAASSTSVAAATPSWKSRPDRRSRRVQGDAHGHPVPARPEIPQVRGAAAPARRRWLMGSRIRGSSYRHANSAGYAPHVREASRRKGTADQVKDVDRDLACRAVHQDRRRRWGGKVEKWQPQGNGAQHPRRYRSGRDRRDPPAARLPDAGLRDVVAGGIARKRDGVDEALSDGPCQCIEGFGKEFYVVAPKDSVSKMTTRLGLILRRCRTSGKASGDHYYFGERDRRVRGRDPLGGGAESAGAADGADRAADRGGAGKREYFPGGGG